MGKSLKQKQTQDQYNIFHKASHDEVQKHGDHLNAKANKPSLLQTQVVLIRVVGSMWYVNQWLLNMEGKEVVFSFRVYRNNFKSHTDLKLEVQ